MAALVIGILAVALPAMSAAAEPGACAPWPGEPDPLPTVRDSDVFLARWAGWRVAELEALARSVEPRSRALAEPLWRHASCLEPGNVELTARLENARGVLVHVPEGRLANAATPTPEIVPETPDLSAQSSGASEALAVDPLPAGFEESELRVARIEPPVVLPPLREPEAPTEAVDLPEVREPEAPLPESEELEAQVPEAQEAGELPAAGSAERASQPSLDTLVERAESALKKARFDEVLGWVERGRAEGGAEGVLRARLEVAGGVAELALGRESDARHSFAAALAAAPELDLDPLQHSPKIVAFFRTVRLDLESAP